MKIVSWNCNGAFRKKFESISKLDADIYIIQECEDPSRANNKEYSDWAENYLWLGDTKNKGIGIFAKPRISIEKLNWTNSFKDHTVKYFLPCIINMDFQLLGVWTHKNKSPNFGYMGQFWKYLQTNLSQFDKIIIAGDFNSNAIWDEWDRWWNHSDVVEMLKTKKIESLYHTVFNEKQGEETKPTFFLQRKKEKSYHIDYYFVSEHFHNSADLEIGKFEEWIQISDHVPIIYEQTKF